MWAGLIGPSEESWRAGAGVLASAPLEPDRVTVAATAEVERLAERVHGLGERAEAVAAGSSSRAALYGDLLVTCAGCHAAVEGAGR